jgi:hypothetical protein
LLNNINKQMRHPPTANAYTNSKLDQATKAVYSLFITNHNKSRTYVDDKHVAGGYMPAGWKIGKVLASLVGCKAATFEFKMRYTESDSASPSESGARGCSQNKYMLLFGHQKA